MSLRCSELDSDGGWSVGDEVLHLSPGDIGIHELENVVLIALLGEFDGDRGWPVGNEVLHLTSGNVGVHELEDVVFVRLLGELDGNGGRSIGDEVLHLSSGNVGIHELEDVILVGLLSQLDSDRGRSISDEVLELSTGDVGIHKLENVVLVGFLSKLNSDGGRPVSDEVLHLSTSDISIHELEDVVLIGFFDLSIKLDELLGNRRGLILDEGLERLLGDVLTVELANDGLGSGGSRLLVTRSSIRDGVVSIIIRETLIKLRGDELTTVPLIEDLGSTRRGNSSDHHGDGDVIVIIGILDLIPVLAEDGSKGIITNNLSESLKGNGVNDISVKVGVASNVDSVDLINWDHEGLGVLHHISRGELHSTGSADGGTISINVDIGNNSVESVLGRSMLSVLLVGLLMMVLLLELHEILLSGNSLESVVFRQEGRQVLSDAGSELGLRHAVGTFLNHSLVEG